jgi:hypothetical protein
MGNETKAHRAYAELLNNWRRADTEFAALQEAKEITR